MKALVDVGVDSDVFIVSLDDARHLRISAGDFGVVQSMIRDKPFTPLEGRIYVRTNIPDEVFRKLLLAAKLQKKTEEEMGKCSDRARRSYRRRRD